MSKKHYIEFAKRILLITNRQAAWDFADIVADIAAKDNPRFDKKKFMLVCGCPKPKSNLL